MSYLPCHPPTLYSSFLSLSPEACRMGANSVHQTPSIGASSSFLLLLALMLVLTLLVYAIPRTFPPFEFSGSPYANHRSLAICWLCVAAAFPLPCVPSQIYPSGSNMGILFNFLETQTLEFVHCCLKRLPKCIHLNFRYYTTCSNFIIGDGVRQEGSWGFRWTSWPGLWNILNGVFFPPVIYRFTGKLQTS